jgi:hypothetical protein
MTPDLDALEAAADKLARTHVTSDSAAAAIIDDQVATVLELVAEVRRLREALLESPAMAELIRASPGALRFRCKEYDDLRAGLEEACDLLDGILSQHGPMRPKLARLRKLAQP